VLECGLKGPGGHFFMCSKPAAPFRRLVIGMSMATRVSELGNGVAKVGVGTYADLDDRMLVLDFQAGNEGAFSEIHRRYFGLARHVCQRILRNAEDADEATQEAMLRVYQGLVRFNGRYALQPWVARIATNVSLDVTRARARRPKESDWAISELHEVLHEPSDDPLEQVERSLDRERINRVLDLIPEHHRDALVLRELEGRSHKEIGEVLGVTPSQAKALIHRAKGSFRRAWDGVKDRRGLGVLVPIFTAPFRGRGFLGRLLQPATELAATSTAAPAATAPLVTAGERVTAAALAVIVAGSAAVGAVTLKHEPHKVKPVSTPSAAVVVAASPSPKPTAVRNPVRKETTTKAKLIPAIVASPSPSPAASSSPSPSPSESPSATESTATESTASPPLPLSTMSFKVAAPAYACGCGPMKLVSEDKVYGKVGEGVTFQQTAEGAAPNASGVDGAWSVKVGIFGSAKESDSSGGFVLYLYTNDRYYEYEAVGQLSSVSQLKSGGYRFTYSGTYRLITTVDAHQEPVLQEGTFVLTVDFRADGTSLYQTAVSLQESAAA
jgi:RNA polymerase sigma factor (sigma-70 family)